MIIKALLYGLFYGSALAIGGGIVGLLIFVITVWCGWWDSPGGGMVVFPLVLIPAVICGFCGFNMGVTRSRGKSENAVKPVDR